MVREVIENNSSNSHRENKARKLLGSRKIHFWQPDLEIKLGRWNDSVFWNKNTFWILLNSLYHDVQENSVSL